MILIYYRCYDLTNEYQSYCSLALSRRYECCHNPMNEFLSKISKIDSRWSWHRALHLVTWCLQRPTIKFPSRLEIDSCGEMQHYKITPKTIISPNKHGCHIILSLRNGVKTYKHEAGVREIGQHWCLYGTNPFIARTDVILLSVTS